jgi:SpoVK/Ycf46/Vps4 family AAA+-type ATPase
MINVRAANVLDKWLGGSEAAIRSLFSRARSAAPCILFFDEIDAIASNRGTDGESVDVMSRLLSTLLNELDGVNSEGQANVLVVACTNRIDDLDAALIRPGRLAEHICLLPPDENDAREILTQTLAKVPVDIHLDVEAWASRLSEAKFSCAQVEGLAREAVLRCLRRCNENSKIHVTSQDFDSAARALML